MGALRKSTGNMYSWVSNMWSPGHGCEHQCSYCSSKNKRWNYDPGSTFIPDQKFPNLGHNQTIFIGHTCDMWSEEVPSEFISKVLWHCFKFKDNRYVFQSKNPSRFLKLESVAEIMAWFNKNEMMFGTTIETNRMELINQFSKAPDVHDRSESMKHIKLRGFKTFITIEPIMDFDVVDLTYLVCGPSPDFINIGADSKGHNLPEPSAEKVRQLIANIQKYGIEIRNKENLKRLGV